MIYSIPIFFLFSLLLFKINKRIIISIISFILFLILALRENIGFDYEQYKFFYESRILPVEPISRLLTEFSFIFNDYHVYFIIFSFITILPIWRVSYNLSSYYFLLGYILIPAFYIESFSLIRQLAATSFIIYGYYLFKADSKFYIIPMIIAIGLHFSAFVFVFIFILLTYIRNDNIKIIFFIILLIMALNIETLILELTVYIPKLQWYFNINTFGYKQMFLYLFIFIITSYKFFKYYRFDFFILLFGITIMMILVQVDGVLLRIGYYFLIPLLFYNNILLKTIKIKKYKINNFIWIILLTIFYFYSIYIKTLMEHGPMLPYHSYIEDLI